MSFTWLTGKMTVSEVQHHHPAWYEQLKAEEKISEGTEADTKTEKTIG